MATNAIELLRALDSSVIQSGTNRAAPQAGAAPSVHPMTAFLQYMDSTNPQPAAIPTENPGALEMTGKGFMRGVYEFGKGLGTAATVAGEAFNSDTLKNIGDSLYVSSDARAKEYEPPVPFKPIVDDPWQLADLGYLGYNVATQFPHLFTMIGIGGLAAKGAGAAINVAGKALKWSPELATKLAAVGSLTAGSAAGGAVGGAMEASDVYHTVLKETGDKKKAQDTYLATALVIAGINALPMATMLGPAKSAVSKGLKSSLAEGFTEWLEEPAQSAIEQYSIEGKVTKERLVEAAKRGLDVIIPAMLTGGAFGYAQGADQVGAPRANPVAKPAGEMANAQPLPGLPAPEQHAGLPAPEVLPRLPAPETIYGRADQRQAALPPPVIEGKPVTDSASPIDLKRRVESEAAYLQAGKQANIERQAQVDIAYEQRAIAEQKQRSAQMDTAARDSIDGTAELVDFIARNDRASAEQPTAIQLAFQQARQRLDKMAQGRAVDVPPITTPPEQAAPKVSPDIRAAGDATQSSQLSAQQPQQSRQTEQPAPSRGEPWQLTAAQWSAEQANSKPDTSNAQSPENAKARAEQIRWLNYGVNEEISQKILDGITDKAKVTPEETAALQSRLRQPVTHRAVVEKAVREGKPVPDTVLNEYPDLRQNQPAQPVQPPPQPVAPVAPAAQAPNISQPQPVASPLADMPLSKMFNTTALKGKTVTTEAVDPETKQTVKMDEPADEAVSRIDKQIDFAKRLLECLSS